MVSVMPCTAKKFECQRPEMDASGVPRRGRRAHHPRTGQHDPRRGHRLRPASRRGNGRPAGAFHRGGRHFRQHRRRAARPPCGRSTKSSPAASCPWPTCTSPRWPDLQGVKEASLTIERRAARLEVPRRRHAQRGRGPRTGQRPARHRRRPVAGEAVSLRRSDDLSRAAASAAAASRVSPTTTSARPASPRSTRKTRARSCANRTRIPPSRSSTPSFSASRWARNPITCCTRPTRPARTRPPPNRTASRDERP